MENIEVNAQEVQETAVAEQTATQAVEKNNGAKQFFIKVGKWVRELFRKLMVSLKRRPHNIALVMFAISFIVYSFNLTQVSNTTAYINTSGMGLCEFATMLFSTLGIVSFLNAFPKRQKPKIFMVILLFAMAALVIACDVIYYLRINDALTREVDKIVLPSDGSRDYVLKSQGLMIVHIVLLGVSVLLTATIPLYGKLFNKINTSIEVEYTEADEEVELAEEA